MGQRQFISSIEDWSGEGVLSILGPTGSGKTALALDFVRKKFAENLKSPLLVSVDSIALYSELDIGSAKPTSADRGFFSWSGIDLFSPTEEVNARKFLESVSSDIDAAIASQRPILLVGGSFFYERALVEGMSPGEKSDPQFIQTLAKLSNDELYRELLKNDVRWREKIHPNDRYRLERFSDLVLRQKLKFDQLFEEKKGRPLDSIEGVPLKTLVLGMDWDRDQYLTRLEKRIREMFRNGWLEEVKKLLQKYTVDNAPALSSVGYSQIIDGLKRGRSSMQIEDDVLVSHSQLVKKQKTWLRGLLSKNELTESG